MLILIAIKPPWRCRRVMRWRRSCRGSCRRPRRGSQRRQPWSSLWNSLITGASSETRSTKRGLFCVRTTSRRWPWDCSGTWVPCISVLRSMQILLLSWVDCCTNNIVTGTCCSILRHVGAPIWVSLHWFYSSTWYSSSTAIPGRLVYTAELLLITNK